MLTYYFKNNFSKKIFFKRKRFLFFISLISELFFIFINILYINFRSVNFFFFNNFLIKNYLNYFFLNKLVYYYEILDRINLRRFSKKRYTYHIFFFLIL
jgi:hypothetical protein